MDESPGVRVINDLIDKPNTTEDGSWVKAHLKF